LLKTKLIFPNAEQENNPLSQFYLFVVSLEEGEILAVPIIRDMYASADDLN
jgi:hypothetical protein